MAERLITIDETFYDTFAVFSEDGFTKVVGLKVSQGDIVPTVRLNGIVMPEQPAVVVDEPNGDGEYRVRITANTLSVPGAYSIELTLPNLRLNYLVRFDAALPGVEADPVGKQPVLVRVEDDSAAAMADVTVQIFSADFSLFIASGLTKQLTGQFATALNPGTYKVMLSRTLTAFENPFDLEVPNTPEAVLSVTYKGKLVAVVPPSQANTCRVFGFIQSASGTISDRYSVFVEVVGEGRSSYVQSIGAKDKEPMGIARDSRTVRPKKDTGIWEVDLVYGARVKITIEAQKVSKVFVVPTTSVINFKDIKASPMARRVGSGQSYS